MATRVLFDVYELAPGVGKSIGIYNYAKNLFRALLDANVPAFEFIPVCNPACAPDFCPDHPRVRQVVIGDGVPGKFARQFWLMGRAAIEAKRQKANLYLSPKGFLPNGLKLLAPRLKTVVVVHDLIPFWYSEHHPGYFGALEELVVNRGLAHSVRHADKTVAISKATADDIAARLGRVKNVSVVHNGVPLTTPGTSPVEAPYIFAITSKFPHKNPEGLLQAYRHYRKIVTEPLPLVVCGINPANEPGVIALNGVSNEVLHACYANAQLFVFLSKIEGFGFPPVEAMSHGTRVLCSDIPSLREVTRNAATYVAPEDHGAVARMIANMLEETGAESAGKISEAVSVYSWAACAEGVLTVLSSLSAREIAA